MGKLNLGLERNKEGKIVRDDGEGGSKVIKAGGVLNSKYTPGTYIALVLNVLVKDSAKSRGTTNFIVDTTCVEVLSQKSASEASKIRTTTKVGDKPGVVYSSKSLSYVDDVTKAGLAVLGFTVDTLPVDEDPNALCDEVTVDMSNVAERNLKSPAAGNYVLVDAWEGKGEDGEASGYINARLYPVPEELKAKYKNAFPGE